MATKSRKRLRRIPLTNVRGRLLYTLGDSFVLVRTVASYKMPSNPRPTDRARVMIARVGRALDKPGLDKKSAVFHKSTSGKIHAYSVYTKDPTKYVRESFDGKRTVGRLVGGKFKAA